MSQLHDYGVVRRIVALVLKQLREHDFPSLIQTAVSSAFGYTVSKLTAGTGATVVYDPATGTVTIGAPGATGAYMIAITSDGDVALREDGSIATVAT